MTDEFESGNDFSNIDLDKEFSDVETKGISKAGQAGLSVVGGAVPFLGGLSSWIAGEWSGKEQERANTAFLAWFKMLQAEMREKQRVLAEVLARLDLGNDDVAERVESPEYKSLMRKAFRNWSGAESEKKQRIVRNILANAAAANTSSDDVVSMFLDWINTYSEFHFEVISAIYNTTGITRGEIWRELGRPEVREDSADADLYKLLIRDLSTGSIIRKRRETDYAGNFIKKKPTRGSGGGQIKSAFDDLEQYELTGLGREFVHYAMNELVTRVGFDPNQDLD